MNEELAFDNSSGNSMHTNVPQTNIDDDKEINNIIPKVTEKELRSVDEKFNNVDFSGNKAFSADASEKKEADALKEIDAGNVKESAFSKRTWNLKESTTQNGENECNYNKVSDNSIRDRFDHKNENDSISAPSEQIYGINDIINRRVSLIDEDTVCGFGSFRPKWMQKWATTRVYAVLYSVLGIIQGAYHPYLVGCLSTLEKRFALNSKVSSTIMTAEEVTPLIFGIAVGYYAGKAHRPRMVALGMFLSACCCFITALPYFVYGPAQTLTIGTKNYTGPEYCDTGTNHETCNSDEQSPTLPVVLLLILGSFMKGFGSLAYYAVGLTYMDDNTKKKNTPLYLAFTFVLRLLGPFFGFLMSSVFLKFSENPFDDPDYGPDDPRWVGGWWMGFCLQGVLLVIFTFPIAMFPRRLPGQKPVLSKTPIQKENLKQLFVGLFAALKRLAKNQFYVLFLINATMTVFAHIGHYIMLPKYMENQFKLSASEANLFSGPPAIVCVMISNVLGGFLVWKYKPSVKFLLVCMVASEISFVLGYISLTIPKCQTNELTHFGLNENGLILDSLCNKNCNCTTAEFTPFCDSEGNTLYFSPCYAGCTIPEDSSASKGSEVFENCSCVTDVNGQMGANITEGFCPDESCRSQMLAYVILLMILNTVGSSMAVADSVMLLRCVDPEDKSIALGTFETMICLFGFLPFPITFGTLVDSACLVWEKNCGETGNCWFYDMEKFNYILHGISAAFSILITICFIAMYFKSGDMRNLYEEEDVDNDKGIKLETTCNDKITI